MKRGAAPKFKDLGSSPAKYEKDANKLRKRKSKEDLQAKVNTGPKNKVTTIGAESLSELVTQGRVVDKPSKVEPGSDYKYKIVGKTPAGKSKIKIIGEHDPTKDAPGTGGKINFD